jgi:DNA-binding NarL/FixJ family response regulator
LPRIEDGEQGDTVSQGVRVVVADDHSATRFGVRTVLEAHGMVVCAEAGTPDETVAAVLEHRPDVVLVDILMPPGDGIDAARRIHDQAPETVIIMLTGSPDSGHLIDALRAGARGYLLKDTDPDRLPAAIEGVLRGESAIPRTLVPIMIEEITRTGRPRGAPGLLTEREHEVMDALSRGLSTAQVAERLAVAEPTVRRHAASAATKLGAKTRQESVTRYRERHQRHEPPT